MKNIKRKSFFAIIVILITIICTVFAFASGVNTTVGNNLEGSYSLNAYAATTQKQIDVSNNKVDIIDTIKIPSSEGKYVLLLTVIDVADLEGIKSVHVGYEVGGKYYNGKEESLTNKVYSSLTVKTNNGNSGESAETENSNTLSVSELGLNAEVFKLPYFIVAEISVDAVGENQVNLIVAEKHNLDAVEGQAPTCAQAGWKSYYQCIDEDCAKYFSDEMGLKEIADLEAWKSGEGKIDALPHTEVTDEAAEATCTETGLTEGKHCSVCNTVIVAQEIIPAKGHTEVTDEAVEATCTETGLTEGKHCSVCNTVIVAQEITPAKGHTPATAVEENRVEATCTEDGHYDSVTYCSVCHAEISREQKTLTKLGHDIVNHNAQEPTCTEIGWEAYETCSRCDYSTYNEIPANGHTEGDWIIDTEATCTEEGSKHTECTVCHTTLNTEIIPANGHTIIKVAGKAATCTEAGWVDYYTCTVCNKYFKYGTGSNEITDLEAWKSGDGKINAKGHTEVIDNSVAATCTETGLTQGKHCSVCNTITVKQEIVPATGHFSETVAGKAATCTEAGLTDGSRCSSCGIILTEQQEIPANGHTEATDEAVAPTCTQTGLTEGKHCSVCDAVIVAQNTIPALGHSYVDHICTTCGDLEKYALNGVYYQFTANSDNSGYHFVACGKADNFNSLYSGKELVLANEIDGYPVTEIGASAFANTDGNPIKSVIIPENIVLIGEKAFLDNYGIERAIFFAPTVNIAGTYKQNETGNTTPFYGCSSTSGGKKTNIVIYYNTVIYDGKTYDGSSSDLYWTRFRRYEWSPGIYYRCFVGCTPSGSYNEKGGGATYARGLWSYIDTVVSGAEIVTECTFADVVNTNVKNDIYYGVDNKVTQYTQTQGDELKTKLEEALSGYTSNGASKYVVNVTVTNTINSIATVAITVSLNVPVEVKVNSAVAFGYDLENQSISAGLTTMRVVKSGDNVILFNPTATNYTFLGWAKEIDGVLTFIESTTQYNADTVYYAIWGASKVGTAFSASTHTSGSTLTNPVGNGIDGKWYDNSWNVVTSISTANTVVYTRTKFTFTYGMSGSGTRFDDTYGNIKNGYQLNYSNSFAVLEGQCIVATRSDNKKSITITVDGVTMTTMTLNKFTFGNYIWKDNNLTNGVWTNASVNGNSSVTFKYAN